MPYTIRAAFSEVSGTMFELMQPMDENSIFAEFLQEKGEGLHHVSFDMNCIPWDERIEAFSKRGFKAVQTGKWLGEIRFAFFDTESVTGMSFETYLYPEGHTDPENQIVWFPSKEWSFDGKGGSE